MSSRRRPILSPPGRGSTASPVRARRGAASRNDARISAASPASGRDSRRLPASTVTVCSPDHSTATPRARTSSISVVTSRIRGTLSITTLPGASREAARRGSASFLFPLGVTSPPIGWPPSITKRSAAVESIEGVAKEESTLKDAAKPKQCQAVSGLLTFPSDATLPRPELPPLCKAFMAVRTFPGLLALVHQLEITGARTIVACALPRLPAV